MDTHDEFTIRWREGAYYVTTPDLDEIRVVPLASVEAVVKRAFYFEAALKQYAPHAWNDIQREVARKDREGWDGLC